MQDDNAFRAAQNGFQTGGFVDSQISAQAGADAAAASKPYMGSQPMSPAAPVFTFNTGPYYGGPARPFPTRIVAWFLAVVAGIVFARPQTEIVAVGGLLGLPLLVFGSRMPGSAE